MKSVILTSKSASDMQLIVELAKKLKIDTMSLSAKQIEELEDAHLLRRMEKSLKSGILTGAEKENFLKELGLR